MEKYWELINALQKGKELSNSANWKNATIRMGFFLSLLHGVIGFLPPDVGQAINVSSVANALDVLFGVFVAYSTIATSKKVGIVKK